MRAKLLLYTSNEDYSECSIKNSKNKIQNTNFENKKLKALLNMKNNLNEKTYKSNTKKLIFNFIQLHSILQTKCNLTRTTIEKNLKLKLNVIKINSTVREL